ncbi:hypothetical protein Q5752_003321 [Cryptotrichosporon argae]
MSHYGRSDGHGQDAPAFPHLFYYPDNQQPVLAHDDGTGTPRAFGDGLAPIPERARPDLSLSLQLDTPYTTQPLVSPYYSPVVGLGSGSGNSGASMTDYFPPYDADATPTGEMPPPPLWAARTSPTNTMVPSMAAMHVAPSRASSVAPGQSPTTKTPRHQFTACGACRHRRVKCDLRAKQEEAERLAAEEGDVGPARPRRRKVSCTNCEERGTNCVDEYAPLKAAKQLRRGKRISEIEMLFGKSATSAAVATQADGSSRSSSPPRYQIPELSREFFDSGFFRRFQVQRPVIDPVEFVERYYSVPVPCAAALGPAGAVLCHVLYAWAASYGVDEHGRYDVPEGGGEPIGSVSLLGIGEGERRREADRARRHDRMAAAVTAVLREIDEAGLLRKPSWDGVRVLLLILPLTEGIAPPVERLAMYNAAISQVYMLCSHASLNYDGRPAGMSAANGGTDQTVIGSMHLVRARIYWYAFVHEGITTGLKGGHLHLDDEDLETMQDSIGQDALIQVGGESRPFSVLSKMATAPIRLALACRLIHKALTGPRARRRDKVAPEELNDAWEALENVMEEFESVKYLGARDTPAYHQTDELIRFAEGWKIFTFEAQNVVRTTLEERLAKLEQDTGAFVSDPNSPDARLGERTTLAHLVDIARAKCDAQTRMVVDIVRARVGTSFFEWDASLVRDGTYYAAMQLARAGGSDDDVALCLRAINEVRWAHAKSVERSAELRAAWFGSRSHPELRGWDGPPDPLPHPHAHSHPASAAETPFGSPMATPRFNAAVPAPAPAPAPGADAHARSMQLQLGLAHAPGDAAAVPHYALYSHSHGYEYADPLAPPPPPPQQQQTQLYAPIPPVVVHPHAHYHPHPHPHAHVYAHPALPGAPPLHAPGSSGSDGSPPLQSIAGQYVVQPDGSQVFVPFLPH